MAAKNSNGPCNIFNWPRRTHTDRVIFLIGREQLTLLLLLSRLFKTKYNTIFPVLIISGQAPRCRAREAGQHCRTLGKSSRFKKTKNKLNEEKTIQLRTKCDIIKRMRIEEYKQKTNELDQKERELRRKTNLLVDELVATCDDSPFHKALVKILGNLKSKKNKLFSYAYGVYKLSVFILQLA